MKKVIIIFVAFFAVSVLANSRPFHFSVDHDTAKARVTVLEGNRMVDDIYSQFEAKDGVMRIGKLQIVTMMVDFDSIGSIYVAHADTFTIRDSRGNKIRFGDTDYRVFATQKAAWYDGDHTTGSVRYWYPLTDSSFELAISSSGIWDTLNILIFGETK